MSIEVQSKASAEGISARAVYQLQPFNAEAFERVARYFAHAANRPLTKLDLLKLHALADFFHILDTGRPIVGGRLMPWEHGPVAVPAYHLINRWIREFDRRGATPPGLEIVEESQRPGFQSTRAPDLDDFSGEEIAAMEAALREYLNLKAPQSVNNFFHEPGHWFGRAWKAALDQNRSIDLLELIDSYDAFHGADHSDLKQFIS